MFELGINILVWLLVVRYCYLGIREIITLIFLMLLR